MFASAMSAARQDHDPELLRANNQADFKKNIREKSNREARDLIRIFDF